MNFSWAFSGVNPAIPRNTGPDCAFYLTPEWRQNETIVVLITITAMFYIGYKTCSPVAGPVSCLRKDRGGKKILLIMMSLIWGMEIGFKFASRTVIYLLNPCHITTAMQIYLLAAPPSKTVTAVFRLQLNLLNGPILAFVFPETDSRTIPVEAAIYWIQHGMMFVVPYYLLRSGGVYNIEPLNEISWNAMCYSLNLYYHYIVLQGFAVPSQVNLNHMICPAILDPFGGPYYRIASCFHQGLLCPLACKVFCIVSGFFLTQFPLTKVKASLEADITLHKIKEIGIYKNLSSGDHTDNNGQFHVD